MFERKLEGLSYTRFPKLAIAFKLADLNSQWPAMLHEFNEKALADLVCFRAILLRNIKII